MEMMMIYGSILLFWLAAVFAYVVNAAAVVKALKLFGYEKTFLGWIPLAQYYALGSVCTQKSGALRSLTDKVSVPNAFLQWGWAAVILTGFVPAVGNLLFLASAVFYFGTIYRFLLIRMFGQDDVVFAAVSAAVQILFSLKILSYTGGRGALFTRQDDVYPKQDDAGREQGA